MLIAVFLLGLAIFRPPIQGYLARTSVRSATDAEADVTRISAWLKSDDVLAAAIREAGLAGSISPSRLRQDLEITSPTSAVSNAFQICTGAETPAGAQAIANELAQQFTANYSRQEQQAIQSAQASRLRGRVRTARSEEDRLRVALERLRQEQISRLIIASRNREADAAGASQKAVVITDTERSQEELLERIKALQSQRTVLLADRTSAHPQVIAIDGQIKQLQGERTALATRDLPTPALDAAAALDLPSYEPSETDVPRTVADPTAPTDAMINLAARIEETAHQLSQVTWDRQQAEHQMESAAASAGSATLTRWTAEPASIVARIGGTPTPLQILAAGLLALAAALAIYRATSSAKRVPALATAREIRQTLELPLVAELAVSIDTSRRRPKLHLGRAVRVATHLAEAIVAAIVLACLMSALADRSLADDFASDPLGAMTVVADRILK